MKRECFSKQETLEKVGKVIETLVNFSGVPKGTTGTVTRADQSERDKWMVAIQWHLPTNRPSLTHGQIGREPVIAIETGKPLVDWFTKSEYERFLEEQD